MNTPLTSSSELALDWAGYFAASRGSGTAPVIDSIDLLLGLVFAHPKESEPLQLLDHLRIPGSALSAALPPNLRLATTMRLPPAPPARTPDVGLGSDAMMVLDTAGRLARESNADEGLARVRDIFGAILQTSNPASSMLDLLLDDRSAPVRVEELASEYPEFLRSNGDGEKQTRRRSLPRYADFLVERHPFTLRAQTLPTYDADAVALTNRRRDVEPVVVPDLVGIGAEVDAFAYLIAAKTLKPPLAVGLFGDWGSGKSTFMQALQRRIYKITADARASKQPQRDLAVFKSVVQIEFNAWHYVEGNLWASLVDHIFRNLRTSADDDDSLLEERRREIVKKITSAKDAQTALQVRLSAIEQRRDDAKAEQQRLELARGGLETAMAQRREAAENAIAAVLKDPVVTAPLERLGLPPLGESVGEFTAAVADARAVLQRGTGLIQRLRSGDPVWAIAIVAVIAAGPVVSWLLALADVPAVTNAIASLGAILMAGTELLRRGTAWTSDQLRSLESAEQKVRATQQEHQERIAEIDSQIEATEAELAAARQEATALDAQIDSLSRSLEALTPGQVLSELIDRRAGSDDYRKHLGVPAIVRRDFEQLWPLIEAENQRFEEEDDGHPDDAPRSVNRIVLYIDDLDRCPPPVVVKVLQAVHLLLAFPLFVVVVAVDGRWLANSLEKHYGELLGQHPAPKEPPHEDGPVARDLPTPDDYIEKIFQVPFRIRPLDPAARGRVVRGLVGPSLTWDGAAAGDGASSEEKTPRAGIDEATLKSLVRRLFGADDGETDLDPQSLKILTRELGFMEALTPILGESPRAVKRFVNVYRLMKAMQDGVSTEFTAEAPLADYKLVLFLLAVVTGLPAISASLCHAIEQAAVDVTLETIVSTISDAATGDAADESRTLSHWLAVADNGPWRTLTAGALAPWVSRIARFSFRSEVE